MRVILIVLATARLTRFITEDTLAHWWIVQPARRWAMYGTSLRHAQAYVIDQEWQETEPTTWRQRLVSGLDCRWCVGFHLGWLLILGDLIAPHIPVVRHVWRFVLAALALNVVANFVGERTGALPD